MKSCAMNVSDLLRVLSHHTCDVRQAAAAYLVLQQETLSLACRGLP